MTRANAGRASRASRSEAANSLDFYPTPPWAGRAVREIIGRLDPMARSCWEPACGEGHLVHALRGPPFTRVVGTDVHDYGRGFAVHDFLADDAGPVTGADWIVTNPPFGKRTGPFIRAAMARARRGAAMLLQLRLIEGVARHQLFADCGLVAVAPFCERVGIRKGVWIPDQGTATAYAWFIFAHPCVTAGWWPEGLEALNPAEPRLIFIPPGTKARLSRPRDAAFAWTPDRRVAA